MLFALNGKSKISALQKLYKNDFLGQLFVFGVCFRRKHSLTRRSLESSQHCAAGVQLLVVLLLFGPRPQVIVYREGVDRYAQMLGVDDRKAFGTRIVSKQIIPVISRL